MSTKFLMRAWLLSLLPLGPITSASASSDPISNPLIDTKWRLVEFQSMDDRVGIMKPQNTSNYTMTLNADGTLSMQLNCNRARGRWSASPGSNANSGRFEISQLAMTRALCPPPSMDESIAAHSQYIRSYILREGRLYLSLFADGGIYVWQQEYAESSRHDIALSPEEGGPLNWQVATRSGGLNVRQRPSTSSTVITTFARGQILDNLGCRDVGGRVWCYVQQFGGGPVGYVAAAFLEPAVSPNGAAITGPDDSALRAGQGDFDATGIIPCAQYRGRPLEDCEFAVARTGGGYATVVVVKPDKVKRALFFRMGKATGADISEADGYPPFNASKSGDRHIIRVGEERYEIPDAVILGG